MTRRERLERRLEKRQEWAEGRESKAAAVARESEKYRGDVAFNTQPGHIPERARLIRRQERAFEDMKVAGHHRAKAAGLEHQLERAIFIDDENAAEKCEERAKEFDRDAELDIAINKAWRKHAKAILARGPGSDGLFDAAAEAPLFEAWQALGASRALCVSMLQNALEFSWTRRRGPCDPKYARANAARYRERAKLARAQAEKLAKVEAAPGGLLIDRREECDWCMVTFAEKPSREILEDLRSAGYRWGRGSWQGPLSKLPSSVKGGA